MDSIAAPVQSVNDILHSKCFPTLTPAGAGRMRLAAAHTGSGLSSLAKGMHQRCKTLTSEERGSAHPAIKEHCRPWTRGSGFVEVIFDEDPHTANGSEG